MYNTVRQGNMRVWALGDVVHITDCTNANKRGKTCRSVRIAAQHADCNVRLQTMCDVRHNCDVKLADVNSAESLSAYLESIKGEDVHIHVEEVMGVRVVPIDCEPILWTNGITSARIEWHDVSISDLRDMHNEPRCIARSSASKQAMQKFYKNFVELSKNFNDSTTMYDIAELARGYGISIHSYCALD